jgi:16S rRNA (adenine1518-N6/adenine1519-N6)-dimethyltransferase
MLQREVADRLLADPGSAEYGVLTILLGRHASARRLLDLPPGAFRPSPKVRSTVVRLTFHAPLPEVADEAVFTRLTKAVFTRRRKTLVNALRAYPHLHKRSAASLLDRAAIDRHRRPESLTPAELGRLADLLAGHDRALVRDEAAVL